MDDACSGGALRFGREQAASHFDDYRIVIQFPIGEHLFDWFFNARTGYRAQFRRRYAQGLRFNEVLVDALRRSLMAGLREAVPGRELNSDFEDVGAVQITKDFVMDSLVPTLSKVWFCTKLIGPHGGVEALPLGLVGPRIVLGPGASWAAPYRDAESAWLDIKGAFLGKAGAYQPKSPACRAKRLQVTGAA